MPTQTIRYNSKGAKVADLQGRLAALGFNAGKADGVLGRRTLYAVKAFQAQAVGPRGRPLAVDGIVGALTAWALVHPEGGKPVPVMCYTVMPEPEAGGNELGRAALGSSGDTILISRNILNRHAPFRQNFFILMQNPRGEAPLLRFDGWFWFFASNFSRLTSYV